MIFAIKNKTRLASYPCPFPPSTAKEFFFKKKFFAFSLPFIFFSFSNQSLPLHSCISSFFYICIYIISREESRLNRSFLFFLKIKIVKMVGSIAIDAEYLKEIEKARRDLRSLISSRSCAPIMLRLAYVIFLLSFFLALSLVDLRVISTCKFPKIKRRVCCMFHG